MVCSSGDGTEGLLQHVIGSRGQFSLHCWPFVAFRTLNVGCHIIVVFSGAQLKRDNAAGLRCPCRELVVRPFVSLRRFSHTDDSMLHLLGGNEDSC